MRTIFNPKNIDFSPLGFQIKNPKSENISKDNEERLIFRTNSRHTCFDLNHRYEDK